MSSGLQQIYREAVTGFYTKAEATTNKGETYDYCNDMKGKIRIDAEGKEYRFVFNDESATDFAAGNVVCYDISNVGADLFKSVLLPVTADLYMFAGVCVSAIPFGGCGWIQIAGYNALCHVDEPGTTAIAIGSTLDPANGLAYAQSDTAAGTAPLYVGQIVALEAVDTATPATATTTNIKVVVNSAYRL
jgi:hypothetical protein